MRRATRRVSTVVLPDPAAASTHSGASADIDGLPLGLGQAAATSGPTSRRRSASELGTAATVPGGCVGPGDGRRPRASAVASPGCCGRSPGGRCSARHGARPRRRCWPCTAGAGPTPTSPPRLGPAAPGGALPTLAPDLPGFGATPAPAAAVGLRRVRGGGGRRCSSDDGPAPGPRGRGGRPLARRAGGRAPGGGPPRPRGRLVLTGAPLVPRPGAAAGPRPAFRVVRALHRAHLVGEARMERARRRYGSADYRAAEGVMRDVLVRLVNERYDDALAALRCPVELVWGDDDAEAPLDGGPGRRAAPCPQARLTLCPGAGHLTPAHGAGRAARRRRAAPLACVGSSIRRGDDPRRARPGGHRRVVPLRASCRLGCAGCGWPSASTTSSTPCRASPCGGGPGPGEPGRRWSWRVAGLVLASRWPAAAFATAAVVAARARRPVGAGTDLAAGVDPAAAHPGGRLAVLEVAAVVGGHARRRGPGGRRRRRPGGPRAGRPGLRAHGPARAAPGRQPTWRAPRRACAGWRPRWWPSPARTARRAPRATWPTWSAGRRSVVASPASFNNRAGLARAVNEHLAEGTEVFVAEMGTYGRGEIAELCSWIPPDVAVITAIGPVHLERFGSEDRIVAGQGRDPRRRAVRRARGRRRPARPRWPTRPSRARDAGAGGCRRADPGADVRVLERRRTGSPCRVRGAEIARAVAGRGAGPATSPPPWPWRSSSVSTADEVARRLATLPGGPAPPRAVVGAGGVRRARRHLQRQPGRGARRPGRARAAGRRRRRGGWW